MRRTLSAKSRTSAKIWQSKPDNFLRKLTDFKFKPEQFIVIGDTPNDILCARHFGAKCVAVLTGRNQSREKLAEFKPDFLVDDLSDTTRILNILTNYLNADCQFSVDGNFPQRRLQIVHQFGKSAKSQLLCAVGKRDFRLRMNFDDNAVRADGDCRF